MNALLGVIRHAMFLDGRNLAIYCQMKVTQNPLKSFLIDTPWEKYGTANNPKCAQCMAHCGYEATAVEDTLRHPWKALIASLKGPRTSGSMVAEPVPKWAAAENKTPKKLSDISVTLVNK